MFSHEIFLDNPLATLCFFALAMCICSFWIKKTFWLWGSFLFIAYILAFQAHIVSWISLIPISILFLCHRFLKNEMNAGIRFLLFSTASLISFALIFHFMPGFHNWQIASQLTISPGAYPYNLWLNFDKPFVGIFVLAFSLPLISSRAQYLEMLKRGLPWIIGSIILLMIPSILSGQIKWDPKIPVIFFVWLVENLIFVAIPEEAFFRGFMQREIARWFTSPIAKQIGSIVITSIIFVLLHVKWVASVPFLLLIFVASLIYGTVYAVTKSIEASILCHFGVNLTHFVFFTYPALQHAG